MVLTITTININFSIVLLALLDGDYKFLYVDIGCNGRISDGRVFKNSSLGIALEMKPLNLPSPEPLPGRLDPIPFFIVADDAFPLKENIMKPYSQAGLTTHKWIFNYWLSRACRIVENAFGIMSNRFRVFSAPIRLALYKAEVITMTCCTLHNFLRSSAASIYTPSESLDTEDPQTHIIQLSSWQQEHHSSALVPLGRQGSNRHSLTAKEIHDYLCNYCVSCDGAVSWQNDMI